jgi:hypothetical protein
VFELDLFGNLVPRVANESRALANPPEVHECTLCGTCGLAHTWVGIVKISKVHLKLLEMDPLEADQSPVELSDRLESPGDNLT